MFSEQALRKDLLDNLFEGVYCVDRNRVITYWSRGTETLTGYSEREVVGTSCHENLSLYVDKWGHSLCNTGLCPARKTMQDGYIREIPVSYHHKEGHLIPALARFIPVRDASGAVEAVVEIFQDTTPVVKEQEKAKELERLALMDQLTQIANRACAEARIEARLNELRRYGWPFGILFLDIDSFKSINDNHGHEVGDHVLKAMARTLAANLRTSDFVARWAGDEFLIILQNVNEETLSRVAEKVRRMVEQCRVSVKSGNGRMCLSFTTSVGGVLACPEDNAESLLKAADERMYRSKRDGRNRATV
ncbi:MAG: sensor domain-containing diguanylate cyclase [Thermodesulfobacteriota bacterium]